jgi:hypothetical protein
VGEVVGEPDVLERDRDAGRRGGARGRRARARRPRARLGGRVEEAEDALRRGHRGLQDVELLGEVLQRLEEAPHELEERGDRAHGERADADAPRRRDDERRERHRGEDLDGREVERVDGDALELRLEVRVVERREARALRALAAEELHHAQPR